jgi:predicted RNA polymerase sigma factor
MDEARRSAEVAARTSYGRLLSILAARTRDISAAEDALADAFAAALTQWPEAGVPDNPDGWLLTVARRSFGHSVGRQNTAENAQDHMIMLQGERDTSDASEFGDQRLAMLFVCAHPAIDADAQTPLMLQTVLGLDAARIASAFLVSASTMGQRLVRAKRKIRDAGIAFTLPDPADSPARVDGVLSAIYAAYGTAWEDVTGADSKLIGLAEEAIWLARLLAQLLPDNAEAKGLLSLMLHCESRRAARRGPDGSFIPLNLQDINLWSRDMVLEAEATLREASALAVPGRFQTEAAIQSLHANQRMTGERFTDHLAKLYDVLASFAPTTGVLVARAVAHAEKGDALAGLAQLDAIGNVATYQPWWAARARVSWLAGDEETAWAAAQTAAGLSSDDSVRTFLLAGGFCYSEP